MGSVQRNPNGDCIEDTSVEQFICSDSPNVYNVFGERRVELRVGDEHRADIPPLISRSQHDLYKKSPFKSKSNSVIPRNFVIGLPIPVKHINKDELKLENGLELCRSAKEKKAYKEQISKGHCLLPDLVDSSWSDIEERCFLLGLYIFGKDLDLVKKFVESKTMGDIQAYYYGKFYNSNKYRRWTGCRRVRTRKCVHGRKLFGGTRQEVLLSRLFPHVSEEFQNSLSEASKNYNNGQLTLNEYVFALKAIVGEKMLVQAMAIGEGKQDLSSITVDPPKPTFYAPPRSELPNGKVCSSLTPEEIANFLTGGCRMSKARSNDLFWEAVWPRLLARGWHSEEPKDQVYGFGSRGTLVFLIPGIMEFSRRKLVKGNHYYDCVTDILNKVALDPSLIKLDSDGGENNENKTEDGWTKETTPEDDDVSSQQRHRYLQSRTPKRDKGAAKGVMQVTIVDTSRTDGKVFKLRELRTFIEDEVLNMSILSVTPSDGSDESESEDSCQDSDIENSTNPEDTNSSAIEALFEEKVIETDSAFEESNDPDFKYNFGKRARDYEDLGEVKRPKNSLKCYRGSKYASHKYLSPVALRDRKLSSCNESAKASDQFTKPLVGLVGLPFYQEKHVSCSEASDSSGNNQTYLLSKESSFEGSQGIACETKACVEKLNNEPLPRELIDLNIPQVSPEFENEEVLMMGSKDKEDNQMSKPENFTAPEHTTVVASSNQQPNNNIPRRHGTRNRPPTMKALEAIANGVLTVNTRKKKKQVAPTGTSSSRAHHSAIGSLEVTKDLDKHGSEDKQMTGVESGEFNGDSSMAGKFHGLLPDKNAQNLF